MSVVVPESGGLVDELLEAARWRPILALLRTAREATGPAKFAALREVALFACKNLGIDPWQSRAFTSYAVLVELSDSDPRVLAILEGLLPQK